MGLAGRLSTGQVGRQAARMAGVSAQWPRAAPCDLSTNGVGKTAAEVIAMASALRGASQLFAEYVQTQTHICIRQTRGCG